MIKHGMTSDRPLSLLFVGLLDPMGNFEREYHRSYCHSSRLATLATTLDRVSIGINRSDRGDEYCCASGEILRPQQD